MRCFGNKKIVIAGLFLSVGVVIAGLSILSWKNDKEVPVVVEVPEPVRKYGIPVDSFHVVEGVVRNNQYLSEILKQNGVAMGTIDTIAKNSTRVFDVRRIKSGQNYAIFQSADSLKKPRYFVYENTPVEYFVYELSDSLRVYRGEKEVNTRQRAVQGTIESSLWNTMTDNNLDPMLALALSDIYAWTIDFFNIQKGDRFRVVYDELFVDSVSIGLGNIHAVEFEHGGKGNYAFRFFQDNQFEYFDETGASLRKAFLKAPLQFSRISSRFSNGRMHPVLRIRRPHHGVDYAAPKGTPVMSIGDGTVVAKAYEAAGGGNYLKIKHNSVYTTTYMHLSGYAAGIVNGARVRQGDVIGYVGSTGLSTGPHLDFRVHKNGSPIDPLTMEAPPVEPVHEINMPEYTILKDSLMNELLKIDWHVDKLLVGIEH